jgi:predicted nucleotidyltransferase component of viral defense system
MIDQWQNDIKEFISACTKFDVKMILVGGAAVNFHGYRRHSADIDFWIEPTVENLERLRQVLLHMGYAIDAFPHQVLAQEQNISIKFSPADFDIELITRFNINKTFEEAYKLAIESQIEGFSVMRLKVLSLDDLITSKVKSGRPKDLLDIQELKRINKT